MNTLDRYIARQFLVNTLILIVLLFSFVITVDLSLNLPRYLGLAAENTKAATGQEISGPRQALVAVLYVLDLWWPRLLQLFNFLIGLVLIGGMAFTFAQLVRHRELVATMAGGISLYRLLRPVMVVGVFFVGLQIINQEVIIPRIAPLLVRDNHEAGQRGLGSFQVRPVADGSRRLFLAQRFDPASGRLSDVNIWERDAQGRAVRRITADSAIYASGAWLLTNGIARSLVASSVPGDPRPRSAEPIASVTSDLDPTALLVAQYGLFSQSLSWRQIVAVLAAPNLKPEFRDHMVRIGLGRVAMIACTLLALLIATPFYLLREPRSAVVQTIKCAPIAIIAVLGSTLGAAAPIPGLPPEFAVFIPVLVLTPLAVGLATGIKT